MNGSQHICFTDSAGKALFSIPDNGLLCLFYGNGDRHFAVCHRLDDTHAEIDGVNYSLPDFATSRSPFTAKKAHAALSFDLTC